MFCHLDIHECEYFNHYKHSKPVLVTPETRSEPRFVFLLHCIHLIQLVLASHCNDANALKNYTWHIYVLSSSLTWAVSPYTCLVLSYPLSHSLFCCIVFPFSGSDDSLPELPVTEPNVWTIKKNVSTLVTNQTMVQFDAGWDHLFSSDQGSAVWFRGGFLHL